MYKISVIVPVYNAEKYIDACIESIVYQTFKDFEVIFIDNGGTDYSMEVAKKYPHNKVIIRIEGHLTMSENGVVYDLWDCTHKSVDCYWIVP